MRMIEEAAQVLAQLMGLREGGEYIRGLEVMDDTFTGLLNTDWAYLHQLPAADFVQALLNDREWESPQLEVLADLLRARGIFQYDMGEAVGAKDCLLKSLAVYQYLNALEPDLFSIERMHHLSTIKELLENTSQN